MHTSILTGQAAACARFLPAQLIAARAAVFDPHHYQDLNATARRVLFGVLTFVSVRNPTKAVFPRRDTLRAEALLQSDTTLYRGLKALEAKGYITREQLRAQRDGKFYLSPIALTEKALSFFNLEKVIHKGRPTKVEDGHIKKEHTKEQSLQNTAGDADALQKDGIDRETGLPSELLPLIDQGVKKSAICWLMKTARERGKRLGDVLAMVWRKVGTLRGREVVAYLKTMIARDIDYAWLAKGVAEDAQASAVDRQLEALDARYDGYAVIRPGGEVVGVFEASRAGEHVIRTAGGSVPVNLRFARAVAEGRVRLQGMA